MKKILAVFIAVSMVMVLLAGGFTSVPSARADGPVPEPIQLIGTYIFILHTVPASSQTFNFRSSGGFPSESFSLTDNGVSTLSNKKVFNNAVLVNGPDLILAMDGVEGYAPPNFSLTPDLGLYTEGQILTVNITVNAIYTVTFDAQGGTPTPDPLRGIAAGTTITLPRPPIPDPITGITPIPDPITGIAFGTSITLPTAPILSGSTFTSWNTIPDGTGTTFAATTPVIADITVYATYLLTLVPEPVSTTVYYQTFFIGYPDGMFKPDRNVSRAEVAAALTRALGLGWANTAPAYPDVPATHWAAGYIQIMKDEGIMIGDTSGKFRPDAPITRAEAATALLRLLKVAPIQNLTFSAFPDVPLTYWAAGYIEAMQSHGYIVGYPDGSYKPTANILRAEFTAIASRVLGREISKASQLTGIAEKVGWPDVPTTHWAYLDILEASTPHTVTNAVSLNRNLGLTAKTIPLYSNGTSAVTLHKVGDVLNAIVPVDGLSKGVAPVARQVTVVLTSKLKP